jgi:hypothetical protein
MNSEKLNAIEKTGAAIAKDSGVAETIGATGVYTVICLDSNGQVKWEDTFNNLVVTVGKNDLLTQYFKGAAYTAAWYLGLVDGTSSPTYAAGDTMSSHAGWTESVAYSNSTRPAPSFGSASAGSLATTATAFTINGTATIAGAFMTTGSAKSGTTGTLYSAGSFTGGNRSVANGDTLNVTYTATVA